MIVKKKAKKKEMNSLTLSTMNITLKLLADNQEKAGIAGAVDAIVTVMKAHIDDPDVCRLGCAALTNLTLDGTLSTLFFLSLFF